MIQIHHWFTAYIISHHRLAVNTLNVKPKPGQPKAATTSRANVAVRFPNTMQHSYSYQAKRHGVTRKYQRTSPALGAAIGPSSTLKCRKPSVGRSGNGGTTFRVIRDSRACYGSSQGGNGPFSAPATKNEHAVSIQYRTLVAGQR